MAQVPATIPQLFAYLREARKRNICLIRGAPANLERQRTRRQKAGVSTSARTAATTASPTSRPSCSSSTSTAPRSTGAPTRKARSEAIVAQARRAVGLDVVRVVLLGDARARARRAQALDRQRSATAMVRVRLAFITERALNAGEANALTKIAKAHRPAKLDEAISRPVQPNYIQRPHWVGHPDRDVLGDIPTIGWVKGAQRISRRPRRSHAQGALGQGTGAQRDIADHPDAESAVRGIGSDGEVRPHVMAAVRASAARQPGAGRRELRRPRIAITDKLQEHDRAAPRGDRRQPRAHSRRWGDVPTTCRTACRTGRAGCSNHQARSSARPSSSSKEERAETDDAGDARGDLRARRAHHRARRKCDQGVIDPFELQRYSEHAAGRAAGGADRQPQVDADARRRRAVRDRASRARRW